VTEVAGGPWPPSSNRNAALAIVSIGTALQSPSLETRKQPGQAGWIIFAVFQVFLAFTTSRKYTQFRQAEKALGDLPGPQRARRAFPQIGCALGALALSGLVIIFATVVFFSIAGTTDLPGFLLWLESLVTGLAVLGLATAVASLLSGYRPKLLAVLGVVASSLTLLVELAFALLA
jgi:hypothetical protein